MDLVPKPDQVLAAAGNVAHLLLYGGLADLRPMPRTLIDEGPLREVYHYRPAAEVTPQGDPVLLVTPLAAPALCFDLRRGCSLVEHLVERRSTDLPRGVRRRVLPRPQPRARALGRRGRARRRSARRRRTPVDGPCTWSAGASAGSSRCSRPPATPTLPIASLTVLGSPVDVTQVPLVAPLRPLLNLTAGGGLVTRAYRVIGGAPTPLVRWAFQLTSVPEAGHQAARGRHPPRRHRLARAGRGRRPVRRRDDRLPRPQLRAALPPLRQGQRPRDRHRRDRLPVGLAVGRHPAGPGLRRLDRRHRPDRRGPGGAAAADRLPRRPLRDRARAGTSACSPAARRAARRGACSTSGSRSGRRRPRRRTQEAGGRRRLRLPRRRPPRRRPRAKKAPAKKAAAADAIGSNPKRRHSSASSRALSP